MGRFIITIMGRRIRLILISTVGVLLIGTLTVFSASSTPVVSTKPATPKITMGFVTPHHLLVEYYINALYKLVGSERTDITQVIIISPNHFNYGYHYIQSTDQKFTAKNLPTLDTDFINNLAKNTSLKIEPKYYEKEHGIMVELPFIKTYFPKAKVIPIIIKSDTPKARLDSVIKEILKSDLSHTLIIASIDFTHYEAEKVAVENDNRIINWLKEWSTKDQKDPFTKIKNLAKSSSQTNASSVAMDSPETFYILTSIMAIEKAKDFTLFQRTSSASTFGVKDPLQNTSHIFGIFRK